MTFKRTVRQLIDVTKLDSLEYVLTKNHNLYNHKPLYLNDVIEGDYIMISIYGHDIEYSLYSFNENELEEMVNNIKMFLDNPYVDEELIIYKDKILCCSKENDESGEYELVDYRDMIK